MPRGGNATGGDDTVVCGLAQRVEPTEIHACHGALAVDVGAQKTGAIRREFSEDFTRIDGESGTPAVGDDATFRGVESDDEVLFADGGSKAFKEGKVGASVFKGGAADNDVSYSELDERLCPCHGADTSTDSHFHAESPVSFGRQLADETVVVSLAHGSVEIDHMEPFITREAVEKAHDVGNGEFAAAAVDELDGLTILQVDTGNQHASLTLTPFESRKRLRSAIGWMLS